jgi:hypothetical protein
MKDGHGRWVLKDAPHLTYEELRCHCGRPECIRTDWSIMVHPVLLSGFEELRKRQSIFLGHDVPLMVNSGGRCAWYQNYLREQGLPAAKVSPHVPILQKNGNYTFLALDVQIQTKVITPLDFEGLFLFLAEDFRVGLGTNFAHMDCAYRSNPNPEPEYWQHGGSWTY